MKFDCVIIGTSPMCLIEACSLRASGQSVLMIDAADKIGGAWYADSVLGRDDMEMGPHFLVYPSSVPFLREMGIDVRCVRPTVWLTDDKPRVRHLTYGGGVRRRGLLTIRRGIRRQWARLRGRPVEPLKITDRALMTAGAREFLMGLKRSLFQRDSFYFWNGCGPAVRILEHRARRAGVDIRLGQRVTKLSVSRAAGVTLQVGDQTVEADTVLLTERACLDEVKINRRLMPLQYIVKVRSQIHFVTDAPARPFCLVRFFGSKYFLLSNLSEIYDRALAPTGKAFMTVTLRNMRATKSIRDSEEMIRDFVTWKLLPPGARVSDVHVSHFDDTRLRGRARRALVKKSAGRIQFFGHKDLSQIVSRREKLWRERGVLSAGQTS